MLNLHELHINYVQRMCPERAAFASIVITVHHICSIRFRYESTASTTKKFSFILLFNKISSELVVNQFQLFFIFLWSSLGRVWCGLFVRWETTQKNDLNNFLDSKKSNIYIHLRLSQNFLNLGTRQFFFKSKLYKNKSYVKSLKIELALK